MMSIGKYGTTLFLLFSIGMAQAGPLRDWLKSRWIEDEDTPVAQRAGVLRDVAYGADPAQRLDVYRPAQAASAPVILMVHGGAWRTGDKAMQRVVKNKAERWVKRGFVFVSVNYRLLPKADPLQQADDVAQALAFAQQQAGAWGGDAARFVLMGHSAGAHLVDLLGADPERAFKAGAQRWLGTVSLDSAAMDIVQVMGVRHYGFYDPAFGADPAFWRAASPLQQLTASAPPFLLVCSSQRPDQPCEQARQFAGKASAMGLRAEVLPQARSHAQINGELGLPGAYTDAVEAFMASLDPHLAARLKP